MGFMVNKTALGRFSFSISVSHVNHSTDCSTLIIINFPGLLQ
jgi:hypothetical protein